MAYAETCADIPIFVNNTITKKIKNGELEIDDITLIRDVWNQLVIGAKASLIGLDIAFTDTVRFF
jgi:hypothetical protein